GSSKSAGGSSPAEARPIEKRRRGVVVRDPRARGHRRVLLCAGARGVGPEPHRFRYLCPRRPRKSARHRAAQLRAAAPHAAFLAGLREHALLRGRGCAPVGRRLVRDRPALALAAGQVPERLPHGALRARRHDPGGGRRDLALPVPPTLRMAQLCARARRPSPHRLAPRPPPGDAPDHRLRRVEEFRLQHDHSPGRAAEHPGSALRGGAHRRRVDGATVPSCHAAPARPDRHHGEHPHDRGLFPALRRALCDDAGGTAAEHGERALLHVRRRLQVVEPGLGLGRRLRAVPVHLRRDSPPAVARALAVGSMMRRPLAEVLVNALLLGGATMTVWPLLWMVSVSLMSPGEASTFPPPLLPGRPTVANYHELFAHVGMGRYLLNSTVLTITVTVVSVSLNVAA